ncbi:MAG: type II toxin-antitoxin system ParD family antitoxin [Rudaea sp.]
MSTMNVSLPETLRRFVDKQVRDRAYAGTSEYVRELIRRDRDVTRLQALLNEGLESGPAQPATETWFAELRRSVRAETKKPR